MTVTNLLLCLILLALVPALARTLVVFVVLAVFFIYPPLALFVVMIVFLGFLASGMIAFFDWWDSRVITPQNMQRLGYLWAKARRWRL